MDQLRAHGVAVIARSHRIQYLLPALHGDEIEITTWLSNLRRVSVLRYYVLRRRSDDAVLARAVTKVATLRRDDMTPFVMPERMRQAFLPQTS
jgi:acyl-CoA thioester hydrolase